MSFKEEKSISTNQVKHSIKEIIEKRITISNKKHKIISLLFSYISENNFLDIVIQSFRLNPEFFKGWLFEDLLHKVEKSYGNEKKKEFQIDIIKKYCLFNGEKILYICKGNISQIRRFNYRFYVDRGTLFVTTDRIIAFGRLKVFKPKSLFLLYEEARDFMMGNSGQKELLVIGYQFPISNYYNLKKKSRSIKYEVDQGTSIEISFTKSINSTYSIEERRDRLFEILNKEIITSKPLIEISSLKTKNLVEEELAVEEAIEVKEEKLLPEEKVGVKLTEVCKFCGATILAGKLYCSNCGKLLKIPIEETFLPEEKVGVKLTEVCKFCGATILAGKTYCSNCGKLLKIPIEEKLLVEKELVKEKLIQEVFLPEEELVVEEPIEEEVVPEEEIVVKEPAEEIFFSCIFCGMKLDKEAKFCPQCGTIVKKK